MVSFSYRSFDGDVYSVVSLSIAMSVGRNECICLVLCLKAAKESLVGCGSFLDLQFFSSSAKLTLLLS
jgi:hypothetical protein